MMIKRIVAVLLSVAMVVSCAGCSSNTPTPSEAEKPQETSNQPAETPAEEDQYVKDGTFRYIYPSEITTMNYMTTSTTQNFKSLANFVDTLIEYDQYGIVKPCLATEWKTSEDGLTWTFTLRQGVKWYTCDLEEYADVTANDFVYAIKYILDPANESENSDIVCSTIKNAKDYYDGKTTDFSQVGVKAVDDYTLEYTLTDVCPYFLSMMSYVAFMPANEQFVEENKEFFGTSNDTLLYNGAYYCSSYEPQSEYVWERNPNYWDVDNVFIKTVSGKYNAEALSIAPEMYRRGEIDEAQIPIEILDTWMKDDATKNIIHPKRSTYDAMWWFFDFDPHFDEPYDSENFKIAVNNKAWRLSIVYALDRVKAMSCYDPYSPETYLMKTITPPDFVGIDGKDFTTIGDLGTVSSTEWFNTEEALKYKEQAVKELAEAGCKLPVVFPYYYRVDQANQSAVAQVVEQQLEGVLGTDYIDIVPIAGPANNYNSEVRSAGKYGLMEEGWGPDYADPYTYAIPWGATWSYNNRYMATDPSYLTGYQYTQADFDNGVIDDEEYIGKDQKTYDKMVEDAAKEKIDLPKRYEELANAEAWLINEGMVIPFRVFSEGYVASKLTTFDGPYSSFGVSVWRYKGKHLLKESIGVDEYNKELETWKTERQEALKNAEN